MASFIVVLGLPGVAGAQETDDDRARTHFEAGRLHFEDGAYDRALGEFLRAWEFSHRPALLFNLATVEERLARYGSAADRLHAYLEMVPEDPNRAQIERRISNLRRLQRQRDTEPAEATVADTPPETNPITQSSGGGDGLVIGGAVALGVGGVGFALQGIFGGLALAEDGALADGCGATASCTADEVATANTFAAVSDAMMAVGAAAVVAGAVILILGLSSDDSDNTATIAPYLNADGGGVAAQWLF